MIKQLSLSILALSLATPVSVEASSLNSASNLDVYFNQGEKAFDNGNWSKCEDTFRQWLLLKKDQPQQRVDTAVDYYADCTAFNAGDEFQRGLHLWNQMPKKIVGGEVRYKESHWKKVSPYFESSLEKAKVSIGLRANNSFAWMTKGVSEYHLFRFSDACESLNITKETLQNEGSSFHPQLEVALQESCKYASGPQGPQKTSQFNHRELYAGTSKSYEDQLKAKIEYAEKCHEDLPGTNYYYDRCQGTTHRY